MIRAKPHSAGPVATVPRLAPRIAIVLVAKFLVLVVLWSLFVRDQRVAVDAHGTAAAFGLLDATPGSK
jgi:hypothetical protein